MSNKNRNTFNNGKSGQNILSYQTSAKFYSLVVIYLLFTDKEIESLTQAHTVTM